jgi:hypothetical protein
MRKNLHESRWWRMRLEWLLEYEPQETLAQYRKDPRALYRALCAAAEAAIKRSQALTREDRLARDQIEEIVTEGVAPMLVDQAQERLPEDLEGEILEWAEDPLTRILHRRTATT